MHIHYAEQDDLLDGLPSSDAFAELVRMALEKDPSLPPAPSSAAVLAARSAAGPTPESAAGDSHPSCQAYLTL